MHLAASKPFSSTGTGLLQWERKDMNDANKNIYLSEVMLCTFGDILNHLWCFVLCCIMLKSTVAWNPTGCKHQEVKHVHLVQKQKKCSNWFRKYFQIKTLTLKKYKHLAKIKNSGEIRSLLRFRVETWTFIEWRRGLINETNLFETSFYTGDFFDELLSSAHPHCKIAPFLNAAACVMFPCITALLCVQSVSSGKNAICSVLLLTLSPFYEGQSSNMIIT